VDNGGIADRLDALASLLELADANPYTARAYRRAADTIRDAPVAVADLVRTGRVRGLRGIGPGIEARLRELVETGEIAELAELERELAPGLVGLGRYLGLTARRSIEIARALGVSTPDELREAAAAGRLQDVPGVGPQTEARLLDALAREDRPRRALLLSQARELVDAIAVAMEGEVAGDVRRWRDACELLAVVCAPADPAAALARFAGLPQIVAVIEQTRSGAVGLTVEGVPVELVVTAPERLGTALVRATGAPAYVAALEPLPDGPDEAAVYRALGCAWCPPELREEPVDDVPSELLELGDIRGDLHCHSTWSDGRSTIEEMARAARDRGYEYVAICDHTPAVGAVRGLTADDVRRQAEEVAQANEALAPFRVLHGIECDILADGRLDLADDVLGELDWVQASVHGGQRMPRDAMTRRVEEALANPHVRCLSHPTGRLITRRPENALDLDRIYALAVQRGVALEVNGLPARLDLSGEHVRDAVRGGVQIVCSTDAHSVAGLGHMELAVRTARRGWATAGDILNTRPLASLLARGLA
jgi:DNA polymerase (family X)